jgi:hypothetical protein
MKAADDTQLQIMEHLRALRQEMRLMHEKIDALAARLEDAIEGDLDETE